ncbi:putative THO complex subunit 3 [Paratrimastix pyriformis]|uniref:THO complex subunit 3 n=1 Tax=Paratrimastix pyriformis TaxID=342808 RepID=A0ABQ8UFN9_9EUKA|nr:putative THO complex subunit 3 [Paratrimastix pyriformis]
MIGSFSRPPVAFSPAPFASIPPPMSASTLQAPQSWVSPSTHVYLGHSKEIETIAWSATGRYLASSNSEGTKLWDTESPHGSRPSFISLAATEIHFHPTSQSLLGGCGYSRRIALVDTRHDGHKKEAEFAFPEESTAVSFAFSPDGNLVAGCAKGRRRMLSVWERRNPSTPLATIAVPQDQEPRKIVFAPQSSSVIVVALKNGQLVVQDYTADKVRTPPFLLSIQGGSLDALCFDPQGRRLATGGAEGTVSIVDAASMACQCAVTRLDATVRGLSFSQDGAFLATCGEAKGIDISDASTGEQMAALANESRATACAWHPRRLSLAYTSYSIGIGQISVTDFQLGQ